MAKNNCFWKEELEILKPPERGSEEEKKLMREIDTLAGIWDENSDLLELFDGNFYAFLARYKRGGDHG